MQARECFEKVSDSEDPSGMYYLGMLYLKGIGVKRDVKKATKYFLVASNAGLPKAMYQIAKMLHAGAELRKNRNMLKLVTNFLTMNAKCNELHFRRVQVKSQNHQTIYDSLIYKGCLF